MIRIGVCLRCGRCCIEAGRFKYLAKRILADEFDWDTLRVEEVREEAAGYCPSLVFDIETRRAVCLEQTEKREICKRYPIGPEDRIFPDCGFNFLFVNKELTS